jgi:hypothetical protein
MSLKHFQKTYSISPKTLEDALENERKRMGEKLFGMAVRVFTEYISTRKEENSGGYFQFAFIMGRMGQAPKKDVDYLWKRMIDIYGTGDIAGDTIHKVLGTICMMCVAKDPRNWVFVEDPEKKEKLDRDEIPSANEYFIAAEIEEPKVDMNSAVKLLQKKFRG